MPEASPPAPPGGKVLGLKVQLAGIEPPVWRRIEVLDSMTLNYLHLALQFTMGWQNCHLHEFRAGAKRYGTPSDEDYGLEPTIDEDLVAIGSVLPHEGDRLAYIYDFGDNWFHDIVLEEVSEPAPGTSYPRCTGGERRCALEDSGGPPGYQEILEALADPTHERHQEFTEWVPWGFDPEHFDVEVVSALLDDFARSSLNAGPDDPGPAALVTEEADVSNLRTEYAEPVSRLLDLGEPRRIFDYDSLGMDAAHVPALLRMATDMRLHLAHNESKEVWGPVHAWRVLGRLRAEEAIEPLVALFDLVEKTGDEWVADDLPKALGAIGPKALPPLSAYLEDKTKGLYSRVAASTAVTEIAKQHPGVRDECVAAITRQLERFEDEDPEFNAFLVSALMVMDAVEVAPLMESAFQAEAVAPFVVGDWEDVQIRLGLLDKRTTPRRHLWESRFDRSKKTPSPPTSGKKEQKHKKKRKDQKKSRKKNRKK